MDSQPRDRDAARPMTEAEFVAAMKVEQRRQRELLDEMGQLLSRIDQAIERRDADGQS